MKEEKRFIILGATGSIGTQALEVIKSMENSYVDAISYGSNTSKAISIIDEFNPKFVACEKETDAKMLKEKYSNIEVMFGEEALTYAACYGSDNHIVLNALVGMIGLKPTINAILKGRTILLANKETLVVGGEIIEKIKKDMNVKIIPIDSEHSAIMQSLEGHTKDEVKELIITASGGAFRDKTRDELENVTIEDALKHPNWAMGKKITVDCATMVNKGLEVMEAHFLFSMPYEKIKTVLHFESIIHSLVKYNDGSIICEMAKPDMRIPIQYAITYPKKCDFKLDSALDIDNLNMSFKKMDFERYPMLELAYKVGKMGGLMPTVYNSTNEACVKLFIDKKIKFLDIEKIISKMCASYEKINKKDVSLEDVISLDKKIKEEVLSNYENLLKD